MKTEELREYLKNVLDLETALYENSQVKEKYKNIRTKEKPKKEVRSLPIKPEEPVYQNETVSFYTTLVNYVPKIGQMWTICLFFCCVFLIAAWITAIKTHEDWYWLDGIPSEWLCLFFILMLFVIASIMPILCTIKKVKKARVEAEMKLKKQNQQQRAQYIECMDAFQNVCKDIATTNKELENQHNDNLRLYNVQTNETNKKLARVENELKESLNKVYDKNVIYGKYRNFVAVATLYEYIDSGRCSELEGANGAYNLLESEIRADRIISSLNRIVTNLEDIKNNQYTLYKSIECANIATIKILSNINNTQAMTAYYAKQAAVAASADRFIVGMTW